MKDDLGEEGKEATSMKKIYRERGEGDKGSEGRNGEREDRKR